MLIQQITAYKTYCIRKKELRKNIPLPYKFKGDFAKTTFHLGAVKNEEVVAIASFVKVKNQLLKAETQYQLRGMAVDETYKQKGIGKLLLKEAVTILKQKKTTILWCNAREKALNFYLKQGFEIFDVPFTIPHIGNHYKMYKKIE